MKTEELYTMIQQKPVILDGATGSNLQKVGMKPGVCPEEWILENEDKLIDLQKSFVEAGTNILYAPTFSGNRVKLEEYGLADRAEEINKRLVGLSKRAAGDKALVAGDMTMTGVALEPVGPMKLEALINIYKEQAKYLLEAGVDLFVVETMMSLAETRAAVIAIKEVCNLPVIASLTFQEDGRTLYGTDPVTAVVVLQSIGADIIGVNCSTGPGEMIPVIKKMKEYAEVPILAKPNAGLPVLEDGVTVYPMTPEEFASWGPAFIEAGAGLIGGCCGSTPEHIRMLTEKVSGLTTKAPCNIHPIMLASERKSQEIALDGKFLVIGERINPTGKKKLQEELRAGKLDLVEEMAEQQEEMGAHILDINMGTNGIDEKEMMLKAISKVTMVSSLPLCIDTSYVEVMEAALRSAYYIIKGENPPAEAFTAVRSQGFNENDGVQEANFQINDITVRTAVVSGLGNTRELIRKIESGEVHYDFVEVMACPGGCVGGGGQPIHDGEERAFERGKNLYYLDRNANLRFSHENPDVIQMYKEYFEAPMSHKAHMLLHTEHKKNM